MNLVEVPDGLRVVIWRSKTDQTGGAGDRDSPRLPLCPAYSVALAVKRRPGSIPAVSRQPGARVLMRWRTY